MMPVMNSKDYPFTIAPFPLKNCLEVHIVSYLKIWTFEIRIIGAAGGRRDQEEIQVELVFEKSRRTEAWKGRKCPSQVNIRR